MNIKIDSGWYKFEINGDVKNEKIDEVLKEGVSNLIFRGGLAKAREHTGAKAKLIDCPAFDSEKAKLAIAVLEKALADYGSFSITCENAAHRGANIAAAIAEQAAAFESYKAALAFAPDEATARLISRYKGPASGPTAEPVQPEPLLVLEQPEEETEGVG